MGKDIHLVNIYLKIHNKKTLTMDDLAYLAEYSPECFEKTCKNVLYNIPESKPIMEPVTSEPLNEESGQKLSDRQNIERILKNLKCLETNDFQVANVDADKVKDLLGNLYMELLFPHNEKDTFMNLTDNGNKSLFDRRI